MSWTILRAGSEHWNCMEHGILLARFDRRIHSQKNGCLGLFNSQPLSFGILAKKGPGLHRLIDSDVADLARIPRVLQSRACSQSSIRWSELRRDDVSVLKKKGCDPGAFGGLPWCIQQGSPERSEYCRWFQCLPGVGRSTWRVSGSSKKTTPLRETTGCKAERIITLATRACDTDLLCLSIYLFASPLCWHSTLARSSLISLSLAKRFSSRLQLQVKKGRFTVVA